MEIYRWHENCTLIQLQTIFMIYLFILFYFFKDLLQEYIIY